MQEAYHPDTPWFAAWFFMVEEHAKKHGHVGHRAVELWCRGCNHVDVICILSEQTLVEFSKLARHIEGVRREHANCIERRIPGWRQERGH